MPQQPIDARASQSNPDQAADAAAAYQEHLAAAQSVEVVVPYRIVPDLALANIKSAERYVAERRGDILEHLPKVDIAHFDGIGRLALGVKYAAMLAEGAGPSESEIHQVISEGWELRAKLLPALKALAAAGLVPQATYDRLARGRGVRDMAEDCVGAAQVFRDGAAALAGKHPISTEQVDRAAFVGSWLLANMKHSAARGERAPRPEAVEIRNRMATLLVNRYEKLQAVAHYFEGEGWPEKVPPLMTRLPAAKREAAPKDASEPAPAAPPTA